MWQSKIQNKGWKIEARFGCRARCEGFKIAYTASPLSLHACGKCVYILNYEAQKIEEQTEGQTDVNVEIVIWMALS